MLRALAVIADRVPRDWGVRELAEILGVPPSGAHRILGVLESAGLIETDEATGRYRPSLELYRIAWRAAANVPFSHAAIPVLRDLVAACNETALLGLYDPVRLEMIVAASVESSHPVRYVVRLHEWVSVHAGASGLAIMAFLSPTEREAIVRRTGLRPFTGNTITDAVRLEKELEVIRRRGYAFSRSQRLDGAVGIAAPVFGGAGAVIGDVILTIPEQRFNMRAEADFARLVMKHAELVTARIGGEPRRNGGRSATSDRRRPPENQGPRSQNAHS